MNQNQIAESAKLTKRWTIHKYADDAAYHAGKPFAVEAFDENMLLNEGITPALQLIGGIAATAFSNANAFLGVGDGGPTALTGTVAVTNGSPTVTGTGTLFTTELVVNDFIFLAAGDGLLYRVQSIANDTSLTLASNYGGTTGSGLAASKVLRELATQTGLQASANKLYKGMEAGYPQVSGQTITWRSVYSGAEANFAWREFTVANGNSDASSNLNRKVSSQSTKGSGQTWTLDLAITLS